MSPEAPQIGLPQADEDSYSYRSTIPLHYPQPTSSRVLRQLSDPSLNFPPSQPAVSQLRAASPTDSVFSNLETPTVTPNTSPRKRVTFGKHVKVCPIPTRRQQRREEAKDSAEFLRNGKDFLLNKKDIYTQNLDRNPTFFNRNKETIQKGACAFTVMLGIYSIPAGMFTMFLSSFPVGLTLVILGSILTGAGAYNLPKEKPLISPKSR